MVNYPLTLATPANTHVKGTRDASSEHMPESLIQLDLEEYFDPGINQDLRPDRTRGEHTCHMFANTHLMRYNALIPAYSDSEEHAWRTPLNNQTCGILKVDRFKQLIESENHQKEELDFEILEKSFRLASQFITSRRCAPFWNVLVSLRDFDGRIDPTRTAEVERIARAAIVHSNLNSYKEGIAYQTEINRLTHGFEIREQEHRQLLEQAHGNIINISYKFATEVSYPGMKNKVAVEGEGTEHYNYTVVLHRDIKYAILYICSKNTKEYWSSKGRSMRYDSMGFRFSYLLSTYLCYAIARVLDHHNAMAKIITKRPLKNPSYDRKLNKVWLKETCPDPGNAALQILFGGSISPIGWRCDAAHGLARSPWTTYKTKDKITVDYFADIFYLVRMNDIMDLHYDNGWRHRYSVGYFPYGCSIYSDFRQASHCSHSTSGSSHSTRASEPKPISEEWWRDGVKDAITKLRRFPGPTQS